MYIFDEFPSIERITNCIKNISLLGEKIKRNLSEFDRNLSDEIQILSFDLFSRLKMKTSNFTIFGDQNLKKMLIREDADGLSETDSLILSEYLKDNINAFVELVAHAYGLKSRKSSFSDGHIFHARIYSRYSGKEHDIFFVNRRGFFFIFNKNITKQIISDYLSDYFGITHNDNTQLLIELANNDKYTYLEKQLKIYELSIELSIITKKNYNLISGAISFFDFLAWKGLWQSSDNDTLPQVAQMIDDINEQLEIYTSEITGNYSEMNLSKLISISDTIVIFSPKVSTISEIQLLELHAKLAKYILEKSTDLEYPIRGAIGYGEYSIMNNMMIGPGIDECASWHDKCDWIGVHLTPSAQFEIFKCEKYFSSKYILKNNIPLKNGMPKIEYCIKWEITKGSFFKIVNKTKALLPEIADKYINTYNFLAGTQWKEDVKNVKN